MPAFRSQMAPNELVIDDDNYLQHAYPNAFGQQHGRGYIPRDWERFPYGSMPFAGAFDIELIPRSEWDERIAEQEATKSRLSDIAIGCGVKVKHQQQTSLCWSFATTSTVEVVRAIQGHPYVSLSPASVSCKVNGFVNQGGWGEDALEYFVKSGAVPTEHWPDIGISRKYDTSATMAMRAKYQVDEWYDLRKKDFDQLATCLLLGIPVTLGVDWWGHQFMCLDLVKLDGTGRYGVRIQNSWGTGWSAKGYGILAESKCLGDANAPRVATAA